MSLRFEKFLVYFLIISISLFMIIWTFFLNWGKIEIISNQPFQISGLGKSKIICPMQHCLEKVPIGDFATIFYSEGFEDIQATISIRRWKTTEAVLTFKYKPVLVDLGAIQRDDFPEIPLFLQEKIIPTWDNTFQKIAYFEKNQTVIDLFLWQKEKQKVQKITSFYNFQKPQIYWGKTGNFLILQNEADFFLINLEKKYKDNLNLQKKILNLAFSPDDTQILFETEKGLFVYNFQTQIEKTLNLKIEMENLIWKNATT